MQRITSILERVAEDTSPNLIHCRRKAISTLIPYVVNLARDGHQGIAHAFSCAARASSLNSGESIWRRIGPYITPLFDKPAPHSLNWIIALASPHVPWRKLHDRHVIARWAAMASAVPYVEEVGQSVVDALLRIASADPLRPHIPVEIWAWLKKRPSLPPRCSGRSGGAGGNVVLHVRALGDVEILKSYFLLVWSEWDSYHSGFAEMRTSIREDFHGIGMGCHRKDLIKQLDYVLVQLDRGLGYLEQHKPRIHENDIRIAKEKYGELKTVLLEVDREATNILARTPPSLLILFESLLTPVGTYRITLDLRVRSPTPVSMISHLERFALFPPTDHFVSTSVPMVVVAFPRLLPVAFLLPKFA